ncbi:MAG: M48 family metallopeptidase [Burkholderiales bacterium]
MDFFQQQHHARRHTRMMVVMFIVAVAAVVAVLNVFGVVAWAMTMGTPLLDPANLMRQTPRELYMGVTALTLMFIAFGTISTLMKLSAGGAAVAEMVGARRVERDSREPLERRLLNVVEEMSIASGITMPQVYVMDEEQAINAFAAGYSPNEAIVAVTRGTLENLSRDELQGVIGHEFSHILNGDMRLNIHLMGVIAGIVMIGSLGRFLMDARTRSNDSNYSSRRETDWRIFMAGLCLWLIGSIGVFAGRVIKAAISRQREFLADASSVQFTRNPEGIGAALFKIGRQNGLIQDRHAEDLSHMYFGESVSGMFGMLNTHPPVKDRVERLMGPAAMVMLRERIKTQPATAPVIAQGIEGEGDESEGLGAATSAFGSAASASPWGGGGGSVNTTAQNVVDSVGKPSPGHYDAARYLLQEIPTALHLATLSADGASAALFALLLGDGVTREAQVASITKNYGETIAKAANDLNTPLQQLGPRARMPLMGLLLPSLIPLDQIARDALLAQAEALIKADKKVTIGEFVLLTLCRRHLARPIKGAPPVKHKDMGSVTAEIIIVLSLLTHAGKGGNDAFAQGLRAAGVAACELHPPAQLQIANVEAALYELKLLAPLKKPALIKACLAVVMADNKLTVLEGELIRAICATLDSPLPPLLDTIEPEIK